MDALLPYWPAMQLSQLKEPAMLLNDPGGHGVHDAAPVPEKVPTGQFSQSDSPGPANKPFAHSAQTGLPVLLAAEPAAQSRQRVAFSCGWYRPTWQGVQAAQHNTLLRKTGTVEQRLNTLSRVRSELALGAHRADVRTRLVRVAAGRAVQATRFARGGLELAGGARRASAQRGVSVVSRGVQRKSRADQADLGSAENLPSWHCVQRSSPCEVATLPGSQTEQLLWPTSGWAVPSGQGRHDRDAFLLNDPAAQGVHTAEPALEATLPMPQLEQKLAP
jgi:hypothetical protein